MPPKIHKRSVLPREYLDEDVWTLAVQRARRLYEEFDKVTVQFSGGKDSTATLHAVLAAAHEKPETRLPVRVIFFDEECIPLETVEYVRRVSQRDDVSLEWYCVPIACGNACATGEGWWYPWAPEDRDKWVRELPPEALTDFPVKPYPGTTNKAKRVPHHACADYLHDPHKGQTCITLGIRAAESLRRLQAVSRRTEDNWIIEDPEISSGVLWKAYPIYDWQDDDVWTAPQTFGWDYNRAYDMLEMLGVPPSAQRMGPPFGNEPMQSLWQWSQCYPDVWDKMCARVPGAATAARYAKTGLYAFHEAVKKRDDETWPECIARHLAAHPQNQRKPLARKIWQNINYQKTYTNGDLMPEHAPHPDTGLSWDYLAMIAKRGDRMDRKDPRSRRITASATPQARQRAWDKYNADIANVKAEHRLKDITA